MKISHEKVSVINAFQVPELKTENLGYIRYIYQVIRSGLSVFMLVIPEIQFSSSQFSQTEETVKVEPTTKEDQWSWETEASKERNKTLTLTNLLKVNSWGIKFDSSIIELPRPTTDTAHWPVHRYREWEFHKLPMRQWSAMTSLSAEMISSQYSCYEQPPPVCVIDMSQ